MRSFDGATLSLLQTRAGLVAHRMVWIKARNRSTGETEAMGLWSGEDDITLTLEGEVRTYQGAGALLEAEAITAGSGLAVRIHRLALSAVAPEVEALVKGYETRFAPVEIHRAILHPETRALAGAPDRVFRGMINKVVFPRAEPGGTAAVEVEVASETRALTRTLATKKSDDSHKLRGGDRFRRYGDISGAIQVYWGERRASPPSQDAGKQETTRVEDYGQKGL